MSSQGLYVNNAWDCSKEDPSKPAEQRFFEAYLRTVDSLSFANESMTQWYSSKVSYQSETGKVFHGAESMKKWMIELFGYFEKFKHVSEYYVQYDSDGGKKVHAGFRRLLWIKGNTGPEPDIDAPMGWVSEVGPSDDPDGHLGLQFKNVKLYWDKSKTLTLLEKPLPSDK